MSDAERKPIERHGRLQHGDAGAVEAGDLAPIRRGRIVVAIARSAR
jgi:hypothetical protein